MSRSAVDVVHRFERSERIGGGSYGEVFRGWDRVRGHEVALKVISLDDVPDDIEAIQQEVAVLSACRCDNIVQYYGSVLPRGSMHLTIAMELLPASAVDLLAMGGPLDEATIAWVMRGTLGALAYLHSQARMHRDLKAANVLLAAGGGVKLSDFGVAGALSGTLGFQRATFVGTPFWMAPEVIEAAEQGGYGAPADIWSAGITAIELATGAPPLGDLHPMRALFLIPKSRPPRLPAEGGHSDALRSFVEACLQMDPRRRPTAAQLLQHPLVASAQLPPDLPSLVADAAEFSARFARTSLQGTGGVPDSTESPAGGPQGAVQGVGQGSPHSPNLSGGNSPGAPRAFRCDSNASLRVYDTDTAPNSIDGGGSILEAASSIGSAGGGGSVSGHSRNDSLPGGSYAGVGGGGGGGGG
eukprot:CAMPEP_0206147108 /NCGR_PEP_ID=MMETSP1473-20131121/32445_1 /ASSEMBLY_ACC=CAM_ASM_001109 /TAXON_ID=1461547 /ORGANISM="Stichococcus sp, Strain RCC1054" /LENGTH=412 /DNA_ID=CAMNT_0053543921 /DNA_START=258 /DNA_END=1492 /DNA_ORIENTATION=-